MQHPDDWLMERFKVLAELQQWLGFRRVWGWIPGRTNSVFAWSFLNDCLVSLQLRDVLEAVPPGLLIAPPCEAAAEDQADPNRNGCSGISVLPSTTQRTLRARTGRACRRPASDSEIPRPCIPTHKRVSCPHACQAISLSSTTNASPSTSAASSPPSQASTSLDSSSSTRCGQKRSQGYNTSSST